MPQSPILTSGVHLGHVGRVRACVITSSVRHDPDRGPRPQTLRAFHWLKETCQAAIFWGHRVQAAIDPKKKCGTRRHAVVRAHGPRKTVAKLHIRDFEPFGRLVPVSAGALGQNTPVIGDEPPDRIQYFIIHPLIIIIMRSFIPRLEGPGTRHYFGRAGAEICLSVSSGARHAYTRSGSGTFARITFHTTRAYPATRTTNALYVSRTTSLKMGGRRGAGTDFVDACGD